MDRPAGRLVPDHDRLALVGDADGGDVGQVPAGPFQRLAQHLNAGVPDLPGVVLDPAVGRIGLTQRPRGRRQRLA